MISRRMQKAVRVFAALSRAKRNTHKSLVEICKVRSILGSSRHRWEYNIKIYMKEIRR